MRCAPPVSDSDARVLTKAAVLALRCATPTVGGASVGTATPATRRAAAPRPAANSRLEIALRIALNALSHALTQHLTPARSQPAPAQPSPDRLGSPLRDDARDAFSSAWHSVP